MDSNEGSLYASGQDMQKDDHKSIYKEVEFELYFIGTETYETIEEA